VMNPVISTFAEKVARLEGSSLCRFMTTEGWRVAWNFQAERPGDVARMPEIEHLEAYILNLRFFFQKSDSTDLRTMELLYERECKDPSLTAQFREIRDALNGALDRDTWFRFNDQRVTYRAIFEGMIYSEFAHANKRKHALFQQMIRHPFGYMLTMGEFLRCIGAVHCGLVLLRNLNSRAFGAA